MKPPEEVQRGLVRQWLAKAAQDMDAAVFLLTQGDRFRGAIGFHSQQAPEKYLKIYGAVDLPRAGLADG